MEENSLFLPFARYTLLIPHIFPFNVSRQHRTMQIEICVQLKIHFARFSKNEFIFFLSPLSFMCCVYAMPL